MSDIFVDNIKHQSSQGSGTITLGASGETIKIHAGSDLNIAGVDIKANATSVITIDSSGNVNYPNRPHFYASSSTNWTLADGVLGSKPSWDYGGYDINTQGHFNTSNSRFTAPFAGVYHFWGCIASSASQANVGDAWGVQFFKNGTALTQTEQFYTSGPSDAGMEEQSTGCVLINCAANDYVELGVIGWSSPNNNAVHSTFLGYLVS
jgi:hypothetical protein